MGSSPTGGLLPTGGTGFAALRLFEKGKLVSDNFYWLSADGNFGFLASLPPAALGVSATRGLVEGRSIVRVRLANGAAGPAFFVRLSLEKDGREILPSLWSDNFATLLPGESRDVICRTLGESPRGGPLRLKLEGWNVPVQTVLVK